MKKLILLGVILVNVAFSVDCNAMIKRYSNNPTKLFADCVDRNNANACFCGAAVAASMVAQNSRNGEEIDWADFSLKLLKKACQLGQREACRMLDKLGVEY